MNLTHIRRLTAALAGWLAPGSASLWPRPPRSRL
jgi:hypothetical protein